VAPQIEPDDMAELAEGGFKLVINTARRRSADQPTSAEMASAADIAGLDYYHIRCGAAPAAPRSRR
jgi:sulfide:quinone oxidoreductase